MKEKISAIDIDINEIESGGVAYYRITSEFRNFLKQCNEKHGIIGFEYEEGSLNFGVILNKEK